MASPGFDTRAKRLGWVVAFLLVAAGPAWGQSKPAKPAPKPDPVQAQSEQIKKVVSDVVDEKLKQLKDQLEAASSKTTKAVQDAADKTASDVAELKKTVEEKVEANCDAPEFTFDRLGSHQITVTVKSKKERNIAVRLRIPPRPGKGGANAGPEKTLWYDVDNLREIYASIVTDAKEGDNFQREYAPSYEKAISLSFLVRATPEGVSKDLTLSTGAFDNLYAANGRMQVDYATNDEACLKDRKVFALGTPVAVIERHTLAVDAGTVFTQKAEGGWDSQSEIAISTLSRWRTSLTSALDLRYSHVGASTATKAASTTAATTTGGSQDDSIFKSSAGTFRANLYGVWHPQHSPSLGVLGGVGLSTVENDSAVRVAKRWFVGPRIEFLQVNALQSEQFFHRTTLFCQFGYAHDEFWSVLADTNSQAKTATDGRAEKNRYFLEVQMRLPDSKDQSIAVSPRVFADLPVSGRGPSDVRVSVLLSLNVSRFMTLLGQGSK